MTYKEVLESARGQMGPCHACPVCNGRACGATIPGPGAKGSGTVAIRNFDAWRDVRLNMDAIHENFEPDTALRIFGRTFKYPFFAGPVGALALHYGDKYNDLDYNNILVPACAAAGIAAFTGDGTNPKVMEGATAAIAASGGAGIPTVKPWDNATVAQKMAMTRQSGCFALAMDIDAAGLPFLQHLDPPAGSKTVEQLQEIAKSAGVPFILKGIMTVSGAEKAVEAGAAGIVVSNHGGRVLDDCPATAEVLADIVAAVDGRAKILVDGGIRTGNDVFKALALGADGVLIARPFSQPSTAAGRTALPPTPKSSAASWPTRCACAARRPSMPSPAIWCGSLSKKQQKIPCLPVAKTVETWYSFYAALCGGHCTYGRRLVFPPERR